MKENRYFFYPVLVNMVTNIIIFVPHILIEQRFRGALMSMLLAVPISMVLLVCFIKAMEQFPERSLPDVMRDFLPRWLSMPITFYISSFWYVYGALIINAYADITQRYLSPETSKIGILFFYTLAVLAVVPIHTKRLLFGIEALLLINIPLIVMILAKSVTEKNMDWKGIVDIGTHVWNKPDLSLIAATCFIFSGFMNMVILGKEFRYQLRNKHFWLIAFLGLFTLFTSFFIPIGRLGEFAVGDYTMIWIASSDTVAMQYFIIERLSIPFLLVYLLISLVVAMMVWHIGYELIKSQFQTKKKWLNPAILFLFLGGMYFIYILFPNESSLFKFITTWLKVLFFSECGLVLLVMYLARRKKQNGKA